jgi:hypothetical protein
MHARSVSEWVICWENDSTQHAMNTAECGGDYMSIITHTSHTVHTVHTVHTTLHYIYTFPGSVFTSSSSRIPALAARLGPPCTQIYSLIHITWYTVVSRILLNNNIHVQIKEEWSMHCTGYCEGVKEWRSEGVKEWRKAVKLGTLRLYLLHSSLYLLHSSLYLLHSSLLTTHMLVAIVHIRG